MCSFDAEVKMLDGREQMWRLSRGAPPRGPRLRPIFEMEDTECSVWLNILPTCCGGRIVLKLLVSNTPVTCLVI